MEPCAWQPADLRSPSIVCLIDYFPCNYSPCHTQYFSAPAKVQEGLSVLKDSIHIVTFESLMWSVGKPHVKSKSSAGHQWRPALFDCCVTLLWSRESENFRAIVEAWGLRGSRTGIQFALLVLKLWSFWGFGVNTLITIYLFFGVSLASSCHVALRYTETHNSLRYFSFRPKYSS